MPCVPKSATHGTREAYEWEPYVVLPNDESTPYADPAFYGYGKNKIQVTAREYRPESTETAKGLVTVAGSCNFSSLQICDWRSSHSTLFREYISFT